MAGNLGFSWSKNNKIFRHNPLRRICATVFIGQHRLRMLGLGGQRREDEQYGKYLGGG
jgi:hypothetical protein